MALLKFLLMNDDQCDYLIDLQLKYSLMMMMIVRMVNLNENPILNLLLYQQQLMNIKNVIIRRINTNFLQLQVVIILIIK